MKNTTTTSNAADYLKSVRAVIEAKPAKFESEIFSVASRYAGNDNRFVRQEIIEALTGIKHPLVKCGIGMLASITSKYLRDLKAQSIETDTQESVVEEEVITIDESIAELIAETCEIEEPIAGIITKSDEVGAPEPVAITNPIIGLKVIRKQCKRQGEVTAIEGQHVTVTLADGSKRKPCMSRFMKLYNQAQSI